MSNQSVREMWGDRFGRPDPKIVCVGLNYATHAAEQGSAPPKAPVLFGKVANTLLWDGDPIPLQADYGHVDAEAELALVIGERASHVPEGSVDGVIEAYTCANDVSERDARTTDLIFTIPVIVSYVTRYLTLDRGDVILTGTPDGVGIFRDPKITLEDGDVSEIEIEGIGVLRNEVQAA